MVVSDLESAVTLEAPLPTYRAEAEPPKHIKDKHKSQDTNGFTPVGVILKK